MKAVVVYDNKVIFRPDHPVPNLRDDYVLIKTAAVALNPTDWKHVRRNLVCDGCILGCDFSGTIEAIGNAVSKKWVVGDRVAGVAHGGNCAQLEDGAFAEYVVAKGDILISLPSDMAFEEASTIALGAATVMQGLYQKGLGMNLPSNPITEQRYVLIHGGSTATGALGVQFAKLYASLTRRFRFSQRRMLIYGLVPCTPSSILVRPRTSTMSKHLAQMRCSTIVTTNLVTVFERSRRIP